MPSDQQDHINDAIRDKYKWFLEECLDKRELIMRIIELDGLGENDSEFRDDYMNL